MKKKKLFIASMETVLVPLAVYVIFEYIDYSGTGLHLINTSADIATLLRNLVATYCLAMALNSNLSCGRMDLSLGSQMYLGVIFGGLISLSYGWGGIGILLLSGIIGAIAGLIVGILFVSLRILPMVLGLAITLVYECISYSANSQQGVVLFGKPGTEILSNIPFILLIFGLLFIFTIYVFQYSEFGYKRRAIQGSQKLANEAGINIFTNCIGCYVIAGFLAAISGVFTAAYQGSLAPVLGMSSNSSVFAAMFPMTLGAWIGSFCGNQSAGIFMGSLAVRLLIQGLARLGFGTTTQNLIVYSLFLIFVVINTNKNYPAYLKARRERIALAKKTKQEMGIYTET